MQSAKKAGTTTDVQTGVFAGPIAGLKYQTPTRTSVTNARGEFLYANGEAVTFLVGGLVLGTVVGAPRVHLAHLVNRVAGNIDRLRDPAVTNLARFVQTLDQDGNVEGGVTIAPIVHEFIAPMVVNFDQADGEAAGFASDAAVTALLERLNATPGVFTAKTPRGLRTAAAARNELRRNIRGIVKTTDVKVPLRDGSYVLADVFRPAVDGQYPVVMAQGFYGKAFHHEGIGSEAEAEEKEAEEDRYFSGNPDGLQYENHESVDTSALGAAWLCLHPGRRARRRQQPRCPAAVQRPGG